MPDITDYKLSAFTDNVQELANRPNLTPAQLKAWFDAAPEELRGKYNEMLDYLFANYTTKAEITTNRKLSATGDFTGTWNGVEMTAAEPGLSTIVADHTAQLADIDKGMTPVVNLLFYAVGDGVTDDTANIQSAINIAQSSGVELRNTDSTKVFKISTPLYVDGNLSIDLGGAEIRKTSNTVGSGTNLSATGATDSYAVDAFIIIRHLDSADSSDINMKNIYFGSSAGSQHAYGIFAPRLAKSTFESIHFQWGKVSYGFYGYLWWLINKFDDIRVDNGTATLRIADDGTGSGGSTSINSRTIINTESNSVIDLYGVSYSVFDIPLIDHCQGFAFKFANCRGITLNSPSCEFLESGQFASLSNSNIVMNTPSVINITGHNTDTQLITVQDFSRLIVNGGFFGDYTGGTPANNLTLVISNSSYCISNFVRMPTNGNNYRALTSGSVMIENDFNGSTFKELVGTIETGGKRRSRRIAYTSAIPTSGAWVVGDIIYNTTPTAGGKIGWICVTSGTPGTWKAFGAIDA